MLDKTTYFRRCLSFFYVSVQCVHTHAGSLWLTQAHRLSQNKMQVTEREADTPPMIHSQTNKRCHAASGTWGRTVVPGVWEKSPATKPEDYLLWVCHAAASCRCALAEVNEQTRERIPTRSLLTTAGLLLLITRTRDDVGTSLDVAQALFVRVQQVKRQCGIVTHVFLPLWGSLQPDTESFLFPW